MSHKPIDHGHFKVQADFYPEMGAQGIVWCRSTFTGEWAGAGCNASSILGEYHGRNAPQEAPDL